MRDGKHLKIIAFVGLSGAGKSTATQYLTEKGFPKVHVGQIIIKALADAGIDLTPENERDMREELRLEHSSDIVIDQVIERIINLQHAGQHRVLLDGLGSWESYKILKHTFPGELTVVGLTAPRHLRHHRLTKRADYPLTQAHADQRDYDEIETLGKGGVIAIADFFIENDKSKEKLYSAVDELTRKISF